MSEDLSRTTNNLDANSNDQESLQSKDDKIANTEEMDIQTEETNEITPPIGAEASIKDTKEKEMEKPKSGKPRLTVKEYMSSQKLYDVLKDPEDGLPIKNQLSLKTTNMKSKSKKAPIPFLPFINVTIQEQHATNRTGGLADKPTVKVKISTDDSITEPATTALVEDPTTITTNKILTINSPSPPVSTTNSTELYKSATTSVETPLKSNISNHHQEPPKTITMIAGTKSSTCNTTLTTSTAMTTTTLNVNATTNTAPMVDSFVNTTKSIVKNRNNTASLSTLNKKSVMRSVHIPLSIASKAHKSLNLKGHKMPIHPLSKSRNCVLLSTTSSNTDTSKGIIKFIPRNSWSAKHVGDKCNDASTSDSNSNEAFSNKELEKVTTVDKEVLVITKDVNTKITAVKIPTVPLVGKRKYTDPDTMPPILSFSYQKSLSDYIRKAKEFHKRAKLCSAIIENSNSNEEEPLANIVSTDNDSVNTKGGSGNRDNNRNEECDDESNVAQGKGNEHQQKVVKTMDIEETPINETETTEETGKVKLIESVKDIDKPKYMKTAEVIENVKEKESSTSTGNLKLVESAEGAEKNVESTAYIVNLKDVESTEVTINPEDIKSYGSTDKLRDVKSTNARKNLNYIESNENIDNLRDVESTEDTKTLKNIESVETTDNLKDVEPTVGTKNPDDIESSEGTDKQTDVESAEGIKDVLCIKSAKSADKLKAENTKNLKDIESVESTDNLKDVKSAECTKNAEDIESSEDTDKQTDVESAEGNKDVQCIESGESADKLKDVESAEDTKNLKDVESVENTDNLKDVKSAECTKNAEDIEFSEDTDSQRKFEAVDGIADVKGIEEDKAENADVYNPKNVEPTEDANNLKYMEATESTENQNHLKSAESANIRENVTTTTDIESDLFTYEIFNNVSGISNSSTRNEYSQTKDSTIKILKNIFELKEKVQQQAEEIMSLKAAMKLLNTPNILNKN